MIRNAKIAIVLILATSVCLGAWLLWPTKCDSKCEAKALYRNPIVFDLARAVVEAKGQGRSPVLPRDRYPVTQLHASRVGAWTVTDNGTIVVSSESGQVMLVMQPTQIGKQISWRCDTYPVQADLPSCAKSQ